MNIQKETINTLSKGAQLKLLFNPEQDVLNKGNVVTVKNIGINLETKEIYLTFYEEHDLNYVWNDNNYEIVGLDFSKIFKQNE